MSSNAIVHFPLSGTSPLVATTARWRAAHPRPEAMPWSPRSKLLFLLSVNIVLWLGIIQLVRLFV